MSFETLILLVFFIGLPLMERLMKKLREKQGTSAEADEIPPPVPRRPRPPRRPPPRPPMGSRPPGPRTPRVRGVPPSRLPPPTAWSEAQSLEAAADAAREEFAARESAAEIAAPEAPAEPAVLAAIIARPRPRFTLRSPASLRVAVIAQTVLGPCRATRPYEGAADV